MRRINATFNQKDRVICVTVNGGHEFYYQPARSNDRTLLFTMNEFSRSVFAFFREKGRNLNGRGFGLTIKELYEFKAFKNPKLTHVIERIPGMIEYVLRERTEQKEDGRQIVVARNRSNDRELAA